MSVRHLLSFTAATLLIAACADTEAPTTDFGAGFGTLSAALHVDGPAHDVAGVHVKIVAAGEACDAPAVAEKTVPLEAESLPVHLEPLPSAGASHPFSDALFVLPPGDYHVCATPVTESGEPSTHCSTAEADATVEAELTTEILLYAQCAGDPSGGLDVIVALNDPPRIDDFVYAPSPFITVCETVTVTATASDVNGDALSYSYGVANAPGSVFAVLNGATATLAGGIPGFYEVGVVVQDGHGAQTQLIFPIHVSDADCGYSGACCDPHPTLGCDDPIISACVCTVDPTCCTAGWGPQCVGIVNACGEPLQCAAPAPTCEDAGNCTVACAQVPGADPLTCVTDCSAGLPPADQALFDAVVACTISACAPGLDAACIVDALSPGGACEVEAAACLSGPAP